MSPEKTLTNSGMREHETVLVVDDSANDLNLLQFAISSVGCHFRFRFVNDGDEAINYMQGTGEFSDPEENPYPDLVLLDLSLIKVDGFAVLEWIRATAGRNRPKVFVWTGSDYAENAERAKRLGATRLFIKPSGVQGYRAMISEIARSI